MDVPKKKFNEVLAEKYLRIANKERIYSEVENEKIRYSISVLLAEFEKIALICIVMLIQNRFKMFMCSFFVIFSVKQFMGGTHRKTFWGCLVFSLSFFQIVIELAIHIDFQYMMYVLLGYGCLICFRAPLQYGQIKVYGKKEIQKCKFKSMLCIGIWFILTLVIPNNCFRQTVSWTLCLQLFEILRVEGGRLICYVKNGCLK
ncbi:MAG: accessory gene regulator B family protein [Lachnospiraceae bacterium]|nr:accessory gene regulator B family protein [Lachnospiraceae bacterium]MBQ3784524.1 accessory gene regulator B family protein [Lachnospiraceae bacterium]